MTTTMTAKRNSPWLHGLLVLMTLGATLPVARADYDQAMNQFKAGKYLEAAAEFQAIVDASPDWADGYQMLGICFLKTNKPKDAEKNFLKAIEIDGDKFNYHFNLANAYQSQKEWGKVISTLNTAEGLLPAENKIQFFKLRGFAYVAQKKWNEAAADLEQARGIEPDQPTLSQLGKIYFSVGEYEKAVTRLDEAVRLDAKDSESYHLMAEAHLNLAAKASEKAIQKKHYTEAQADADSFLRLEPASADARYLVGRAALGAGDYDRAIAELNKVLEIDKNNCNAMANQGKAFIAKQDLDNALRALDNAAACDPRLAVAWENKGFVLQKQKKFSEAIVAYERAQKIKPSSFIEESLGACRSNLEILVHNSEMDQAKADQETALHAEEERLRLEEEKRQKWIDKTAEDD